MLQSFNMAEVQDVGGENVQSYLERHKITALFEGLMSKVVKECPADPIEFLIGKLQAIQRQRRKSASLAHTTSSTIGLRSKMQVTGKSVTPKSTATTKASKSAEGVTKSAGARPTRPRTTAGMMSSSTVALRKTTPTKTTPSKSAATPSRPISSTSGLKAPTSIPRATSPASRRPTTAPVGSRVTGSASAATAATRGRGSSAAKKESKPASSLLAKSPSSSTSSLSKPAHRGSKDKDKAKKPPLSPASKVKEERGKDEVKLASKISTRQPPPQEASAEEISEFFGEAKKSSASQLLLVVVDDSEEDSEFEAAKEGKQSDSDESEGMETVMRETANDAEFILEELLQKRLRCKSGKKAHGKLQQSLFSSSPPGPGASTPSLGYHSDSQEGEETDSEEGAEVIEDLAALEDEGVTGLSHSKYKIPPLSTSMVAKLDLKVVICSQCARVIADGEQVTEVSPSLLTHASTRTLEGDFESASQVGSHTQFPQWEASSALDSEISVGSRGRSHDASSDVTLQSCDSWGGLAPPTRVQPIPSDTESELQLPAPPPLEGKSWLPDPPTPHDPHGWGSSH